MPAKTELSDNRPCNRQVAQGGCIHDFGDEGAAWRVVKGVVRLDVPEGEDGAEFAGLALAGDIVGAETLLLGRCSFRATALIPCILTPWPGGSGNSPTILQALAQAERRAARVIALRVGQAADRVARLMRLLVSNDTGDELAVLPSLRDMSDITALTIETVSRALGNLRRHGALELTTQRRGCGVKTCRIVLERLAT